MQPSDILTHCFTGHDNRVIDPERTRPASQSCFTSGIKVRSGSMIRLA